MSRLVECSPSTYYADTLTAGPTLSASIAHQLLSRSPYHAWLKHPRLGGVKFESTDAQERGTVIHALVLGQDPRVEILPYDNFRTKAAQEARDMATASGKIPLLERDWGGMQTTARAIKRVLNDRAVELHGGTAEQAIVWEEWTPHGVIQCRGLMDYFKPDGQIYDLKLCRSAHPRACSKHAIEYGSHIQQAAYLSAVSKLGPDVDPRFTWIFVEELPLGSPDRVLVTIARPALTMTRLGVQEWSKACELWAQCLAANEWPAYPETVELEAPNYLIEEVTI